MAAKPRAPRRSTEEVRTRILEVAAQQFAEHGYAKATMRSIASAAGTSLSVVHRHWSSKEELFAATLLAPFLSSIAEFASAWSGQLEAPWDDERLMREFVRDLYEHAVNHRETVAALIAAGENLSPTLLRQVRQGLEAALTQLRLISEHEAKLRGWFSPETVALTGNLAVSMIVGSVLLQPLITDQLRTDDDTAIATATKLLLYGIALTPRPPERKT